MLAKVSEQRAMGFSATSLTEQGTFTAGRTTRQRVYNYPLADDPTLEDAPTFTMMTETWEGMDTPPAVTRYRLKPSDSPREVEITRPDGARTIQRSHNSADFRNGLTFEEEVFDTAQRLMLRTKTEWEPGDWSTPRRRWVEMTDELGQMTNTEFSYGPNHNQLTEVKEYDYGGTVLLRRTRTEYEMQPGYVDRHVFNLAKVVEVFSGNQASPAERTEYGYDEQSLQPLDGLWAVSHDTAYNPSLPFWDTATDHRGNVTRVTRYTDAAARRGAVVEERRYDITGNLVSVSGFCCVQEYFEYTRDTRHAYPIAHSLGAADPSSPAHVTTRTTYDLNTGLPLTMTDRNGLTTRKEYDPATLRITEEWSPGAPGTNHVFYIYDDATAAVTRRVTDHHASITLALTVTRFNGLRQANREEALVDGNLSYVLETGYDALGRLWRKTRPFREGGDPKHWTERSYDALNRPTIVRAPDASEVRTFHNEVARPSGASPSLGQTKRVVDAWGRERWSRTDALGRLAEVIEPSASGGGSVFVVAILAGEYPDARFSGPPSSPWTRCAARPSISCSRTSACLACPGSTCCASSRSSNRWSRCW